MFSSKTPSDLNRDPEPWDIRGQNNRWRYDDKRARVIIDNPGVYGDRITAHYAPRPEHDHTQHNPPNPILVAFRAGAFPAAYWAHRLGNGDLPVGVESASTAERAHARAVLQRLARLA